jgi:selenocysteine lyase/cysteine desulfurase
MRHVTLHTPLDDAISAGIICFEVAGMTPEAAVKRLRETKIIASTSPYRSSYARVAPSLLNDEAEVEAVLRAIRALA